MNLYLGIDAGTTTIKVGLFNREGKLLAFSSQEYALEIKSDREIEVAPETYWQATIKGIKEVLSKDNINANDIRALAISSQGQTFIPLDKGGNELRKAMVWLDSRAQEQEKKVKEKISGSEYYKQVGFSILSFSTLCKLLWIKENEPEIYSHIYAVLLLKDYLAYKLTGQKSTDYTIAGSSGCYSMKENRFWKELFHELELKEDIFPPVKSPGERVGNILPEVSQSTGLSSRTVVIEGGWDQCVSALGAGNINPGMLTETTGSALALYTVSSEPLYDSNAGYIVGRHVVPDKFFSLPYLTTGGMAFTWFRNMFSPIKEVSYNELTQLAKGVELGCNGLIFCPHLSGKGSPKFNNQARGFFTGLGLHHTAAHMTRAVMEGVVFAMQENIAYLKSQGLTIERIRSLGGGTKSDLWLDIKAQVTGLPIEVPEVTEAACLGNAILAGVSMGEFSNFEEAVENMCYLKKSFSPREKDVVIYKKYYQKYLDYNLKING